MGELYSKLRAKLAWKVYEALKWLPDDVYLRLMYLRKMHKVLNLDNPKAFNEKIQWLKLYDRKDEYVTLVDKYAVKGYVGKLIGEEHVIPTIGVWKSPEEIDWGMLPERFVLKTTHDSGGIVICKDKNKLDLKAVCSFLKERLKHNYYYYAREWAYKFVTPRIIAEPYLVDDSGELVDYKVFCFNGEPKVIQVDLWRFSRHMRNFYTTEWRPLEFRLTYPNFDHRLVAKPKKLNEMLELARLLSKDKLFVRVDLYEIRGQVFFGEFTLYPGAGFERFEPESWDFVFGEMLVLNRPAE